MNSNKMLIGYLWSSDYKKKNILFFLSAFPHECSTTECIHLKNVDFDYLK